MIERAKEYIDKCAPKYPKPAAIAKEFNQSQQNLYRLFRKIEGESIQRYITRQKLNYAQEQLCNTAYTVLHSE